MDPRLSTLLRRQRGVVARWQASALGISSDVYDGQVRRGRLVAVEHGVHRSVDVQLDDRGELLAACLRCGPGAAVAGPLVLRWLGVDTVPADAGAGLLLPTSVERPRLRQDWPVWRTSAPFRIHLVDRVPSVGPARAVLESVRVLGREEWLGLVDQAHWRRRPPRTRVLAELASMPPGNVVARRAGAWARGLLAGEESNGERRMFAALGPSLAARFERQARVSSTRRVDGLERRSGVVLEYQGRDHHHVGTASLEEERDNELRALGLHPEYVVAEDLADPVRLRRRVVAAIEQAMAISVPCDPD